MDGDRPAVFDPTMTSSQSSELDPVLDPLATDSTDGTTDSTMFEHIPVMSQEVLDGLAIQPGGLYLDATVGGGGHSAQILAYPDVQVVAIDQDEQALQAAQTRLQPFGDRVQFWRGNFSDYDPGEGKFDGILADLGVSSAQFDIPDRGFSFRHSAPLDMRMDQRQDLTAADVINTWDERSLADAFYTYGEERRSRQIARRIVEQRPFHSTTDLANTIAYAVPKSYRYGRIHPATRSFQALRIVVNRELDVLEKFLDLAPSWLKPGGRLVAISFHSLEDRIVKHRFKDHPQLTVITKKPIVPTDEEIQHNGRSRSAKLRVAQRHHDRDADS